MGAKAQSETALMRDQQLCVGVTFQGPASPPVLGPGFCFRIVETIWPWRAPGAVPLPGRGFWSGSCHEAAHVRHRETLWDRMYLPLSCKTCAQSLHSPEPAGATQDRGGSRATHAQGQLLGGLHLGPWEKGRLPPRQMGFRGAPLKEHAAYLGQHRRAGWSTASPVAFPLPSSGLCTASKDILPKS